MPKMAKHAPGEARKKLKYCPGGLKMRPRGAKTGPTAARKHQKGNKNVFFAFFLASSAPQERPRAPQEGPKSAQERPREPQEGPKSVPRGSQEGPKSVPSGMSKKPLFLHANPLARRLQRDCQNPRKIDENRPREVRKSIEIAKSRARGPRRGPRRPRKSPREA